MGEGSMTRNRWAYTALGDILVKAVEVASMLALDDEALPPDALDDPAPWEQDRDLFVEQGGRLYAFHALVYKLVLHRLDQEPRALEATRLLANGDVFEIRERSMMSARFVSVMGHAFERALNKDLVPGAKLPAYDPVARLASMTRVHRVLSDVWVRLLIRWGKTGLPGDLGDLPLMQYYAMTMTDLWSSRMLAYADGLYNGARRAWQQFGGTFRPAFSPLNLEGWMSLFKQWMP